MLLKLDSAHSALHRGVGWGLGVGFGGGGGMELSPPSCSKEVICPASDAGACSEVTVQQHHEVLFIPPLQTRYDSQAN